MKIIMQLKKLFYVCTLTGSFALTAHAGNSGGGGNINAGAPVSATTVRSSLETLQTPLTVVFKYLTIAYYNDQGHMGTVGRLDIGKILFQQNSNIFEKIKNVKPIIVEDGSCKVNGLSEDGAAYINPDRICLDAFRIAANPKVGTLNIFVTTLALAAHEYAHLVGADEEQANFIQGLVLKDVRESMKDDYPRWVKSFSDGIDEGFDALNLVLADLNTNNDWSQTCFDMMAAVQNISTTLNGASNQGYDGKALFSREEFNKVLPFIYGISGLEFACKNDGDIMKMRAEIFGAKTEVPVMEYLAKRFPGSSGYISVIGVVKRMDYHDAGTLRLGILDLATMLNTLQSMLVY